MIYYPAEACALAWLEMKAQKLQAEIDAALPESGPLRDKLNAVRRTAALAIGAAELVKQKDFDGLLSLFESAGRPKFPDDGIIEKPIAPKEKET